MSIEHSFEAVSYRGTFRDYQRHLLKKLEDRLDDKKLNIVTPPGSGKVVLGLELIRRMGKPCLIISSTDVMRNHWAEHFVTDFLPDEEQPRRESYISYDLMAPALLTSVTYQTLHDAFSKIVVKDGKSTVGFTDTDVIRLLQECGIRTVLLDEPHHLESQWQDSLESFLGVLGGEFHVISLTSNPPYDLRNEEWDRYENLCGEISEEIHIPELVKGYALCPHEDYVYLNYPTQDESDGIRGYRTRVDEAVAEAVTLPFMGELGRRIYKLYSRKKMDFLYSHHDSVVGTLELLHEYGCKIDTSLYSHLTGHKNITPLTADTAQRVINFLLESQTLLRDGEKDQLREVFTRYRVVEHGYVLLALTPKVRRTLVASVGKLDSIVAITEAESRSKGDSLRQIVLTDSVRSAELDQIGTDTAPGHVSLVSSFNTLIAKLPNIPVGCLTETCAVLPAYVLSVLHGRYGLSETDVKAEPIADTSYARYIFADPQQMTKMTARCFKDGQIHILIGSADALGNGWDDSFVNTLIVASFNGSFVEINRIRGRVIHADKENSRKTAHIWHLVTMEHSYSITEYPKLRLASRLTTEVDGGLAADYRHLSRRFECYMGLNLQTGELENGIDRLGLKTIPQADSIESVNRAMLERANSGSDLIAAWNTAMEDTTKPISEVRVPKEAKIPVFTPGNTLLLLASLVGLFAGVYAAGFLALTLIVYTFFNNSLVLSGTVVIILIMFVMTLVIVALSIAFIIYFLPLLIRHTSASLSIRSLSRGLLKALKDIGEVNKEAVLVMETLPDKSGYRLYIDNCNHDEQITFQKAVAEMFSPLRNPRYIFVRSGWFHRLLWRWSLACPSVISKNDISVKVLEKYIRRSMGSVKFQYTHSEPGWKHVIFARNKSYLNSHNKPCEKRIHLLKHERNL